MSIPVDHTNAAYWDLIADDYDRNFPETVIGKVQRDAVWHELDRNFRPGMRILELNCGTGIDAVHLGQLGVHVLACDFSSKMIDAARRRSSAAGLDEVADFRVLDTEKIETLIDEGPFDGAFSNFSGLNCVRDISGVADSLARLLKPNAQVLLCMVGRFSPWEMAWRLAQGEPRLALRSFRRRPTAGAGQGEVLVHYPSVRDMTRMFAAKFRIQSWKGIGIAVPPSCLDRIAGSFPKTVHGLAKLDRYLSRVPIFRSMGDCVLMQFERLNG